MTLHKFWIQILGIQISFFLCCFQSVLIGADLSEWNFKLCVELQFYFFFFTPQNKSCNPLFSVWQLDRNIMKMTRWFYVAYINQTFLSSLACCVCSCYIFKCLLIIVTITECCSIRTSRQPRSESVYFYLILLFFVHWIQMSSRFYRLWNDL